MARERPPTLANFRPVDGGYHVVANETVAALLPPGRLDRTRTADEVGLPETLINTDKNNSPRVGFAWRLDESSKTVLRGGFGLFHPTVAVQGIRDLLATNEFRFTTRQPAAASGTASPAARRHRPRRLRQPGNRPQPPEPRHLSIHNSRSSTS